MNLRNWVPAYAGTTTASYPRATSTSHPRATSTSHPRRRVSNFLLLLALFLFCADVAAYSIQVPDFNKLERQLRIRPSQKAQFDAAVQATQRALMSVALAGLQAKEALSQEMAKPIPDFNVLFRAHQEAIDLAGPNFREAGTEWQRLFTMLDRSQVDAAKRFLEEQLGSLAAGWM